MEYAGTEHGWRDVDEHLYRGEVILALDATRQRVGPSMRRALHALEGRLSYLVQTRPSSFQVPLSRFGSIE